MSLLKEPLGRFSLVSTTSFCVSDCLSVEFKKQPLLLEKGSTTKTRQFIHKKGIWVLPPPLIHYGKININNINNISYSLLATPPPLPLSTFTKFYNIFFFFSFFKFLSSILKIVSALAIYGVNTT